MAGLVTSLSPVPLNTLLVGQRCTLNLSRAETSSRWCGVVVRRGVPAQLLELWANPHAGDRRVRATLKPLKKSRRSSDEDDLQYTMQVLQDENRRFRQRYEDVSVELQKLNLRLREAEEPLILVTHGYDMTSPIVELPSLEGRYPGLGSTFTTVLYVFSISTKRLTEEHLGSRRLLCGLPFTPTQRCLRLE
ncbi:gamma-aminobutyric acid type B receptor subunit 2 [Trichonephila clavipes]|nr:gamma-aminobutyric acid type B receptor subunit 2 [Trichonephila clavipes]